MPKSALISWRSRSHGLRPTRTVPVRKAIEDELQAVLSGKKSPKEGVSAAQKSADEILRPYIEQTAMKLPQ